MGTSARLAFPPDSEAGRIQAILQMRSWEVWIVISTIRLSGPRGQTVLVYFVLSCILWPETAVGTEQQ